MVESESTSRVESFGRWDYDLKVVVEMASAFLPKPYIQQPEV